jgi:single-strand DNA-binding protein
MALNKCMFIGRLGADPEIRSTPSGAQVANFRIAVTDTWKDKDGQRQESTEWVTCVAWRKSAEIIQRYLRKGSKVYIEGKMKTRSWEDKKSGGKRYTTEIEVENFEMLDSRPSEGGGEYEQRQGENGSGRQQGGFEDMPSIPEGVSPGDDDLPFN